MKLLLSIAFIVSFGTSDAWAQEIGSVVLPSTNAPMRAAPPGGFFNLPGARTGMVDSQQKYTITDELVVQRGFGTDTWVQVAPVDNDQLSAEGSGWVYWGEASGGSPNFVDTMENNADSIMSAPSQ